MSEMRAYLLGEGQAERRDHTPIGLKDLLAQAEMYAEAEKHIPKAVYFSCCTKRDDDPAHHHATHDEAHRCSLEYYVRKKYGMNWVTVSAVMADGRHRNPTDGEIHAGAVADMQRWHDHADAAAMREAASVIDHARAMSDPDGERGGAESLLRKLREAP